MLKTISQLGTILPPCSFPKTAKISGGLANASASRAMEGSIWFSPVHAGAHCQSASYPSALHFHACDLSRLEHSLLLLSLAHEADFQPGWGTGSSLRLSVASTAQRHHQVISFLGTCNFSGLCNEGLKTLLVYGSPRTSLRSFLYSGPLFLVPKIRTQEFPPVMGAELCPPKFICWPLTPSTSECDCFWKPGL